MRSRSASRTVWRLTSKRCCSSASVGIFWPDLVAARLDLLGQQARERWSSGWRAGRRGAGSERLLTGLDDMGHIVRTNGQLSIRPSQDREPSGRRGDRTRRSVRAFLPTPVPRATVEEILTLASRSAQRQQHPALEGARGRGREAPRALAAPSTRRSTATARTRTSASGTTTRCNWREPFLGRRRKIGWDLYGLLGIAKGDFEGTESQRRRNYDFFDAPVGLIFTLDEDLEIGSWLDLGIYIGAVMIAARGLGLDTCPQAALANVHTVLRARARHPRAARSSSAAWGSATPTPSAPENRLVTERAPAGEFATFEGF